MLFILYEKNSSSVGESNGTVLSSGNFGKIARNSPRSIVRKCDEANGSVIFRLFRQERERGIRLQLFLFFFHKKSQWKGNRKDCCTICCPAKTTIFFFRSKESATSSFKKNEYRKGGAPPFFFLTARKQLIGWLVFPAG